MSNDKIDMFGARVLSSDPDVLPAFWQYVRAETKPQIKKRLEGEPAYLFDDLESASLTALFLLCRDIGNKGRLLWRPTAGAAYVSTRLRRAWDDAYWEGTIGTRYERRKYNRLVTAGGSAPKFQRLAEDHKPGAQARENPDIAIIDLWEEVVKSCNDRVDEQIVELLRVGEQLGEIASHLRIHCNTVSARRENIWQRFARRNPELAGSMRAASPLCRVA